jgi:hypothetical protein
MITILAVVLLLIVISTAMVFCMEFSISFLERKGPIDWLRARVGEMLTYREQAIKELEQLFDHTVSEQYAWNGSDSTPLDVALGEADNLLVYIHNLRVEFDMVSRDFGKELQRQELLSIKSRVTLISRRRIEPECRKLSRIITREVKRYIKQTAKASIERAIQPPPKIAERVLYYSAPRRVRLAVLGDLEEEYREIHRRFGERDALLWYRWQAAKSIGFFLLRLIIKLRSISWLVDIFRRFI